MIYLDYNATTPVNDDALSVMLPYFTQFYGNASSRAHLFGWDAKEGVDKARAQVAGLIGASHKEIVFTSGATESINLAIKGLFGLDNMKGKNHIITAKTEHKAVLDTCDYLSKKRNAKISFLEVEADGNINLKTLENTITAETVCVALMFANNETGLVHPVDKIAAICKKNNVYFFSDATQAVGKTEVHPKKLGINLMAFSAHKMYGPKGVGALYVKDGIDLQEQQNGGQHERKKRSGTLNVPGIVGFGMAAEVADKTMSSANEKLKRQRDFLENSLLRLLQGVTVNGDINNRMSHVTNLLFRNIIAEDLMLALSTHVALSSGAACNSASVLPSHVLKAMHLSDDDALSSIRFSLGRQTTDAEIDVVIKKVIEVVNRLRG